MRAISDAQPTICKINSANKRIVVNPARNAITFCRKKIMLKTFLFFKIFFDYGISNVVCQYTISLGGAMAKITRKSISKILSILAPPQNLFKYHFIVNEKDVVGGTK